MSAQAFSELVSKLILDEQFRERFFGDPGVEMKPFDLSPQEEDLLSGPSLVVGFDQKNIYITTQPDLKGILAMKCKCSYTCDVDDFTDAHREVGTIARA